MGTHCPIHTPFIDLKNLMLGCRDLRFKNPDFFFDVVHWWPVSDHWVWRFCDILGFRLNSTKLHPLKDLKFCFMFKWPGFPCITDVHWLNNRILSSGGDFRLKMQILFEGWHTPYLSAKLWWFMTVLFVLLRNLALKIRTRQVSLRAEILYITAIKRLLNWNKKEPLTFGRCGQWLSNSGVIGSRMNVECPGGWLTICFLKTSCSWRITLKWYPFPIRVDHLSSVGIGLESGTVTRRAK